MREKIAYLQGLVDGMKIEDEQQAKLLTAVIDALKAMAEEIEDNQANIDEMDECIDDIYAELDTWDDEDAFDESSFNETVCPSCGETVYFDEDMLDDEEKLICPNCNANIFPEDD
jgi:formylmethanofuran dehydrogenase subunit E